MNETIKKFGYPQTMIAEYDHWVVLLRQKQITACSLILACKELAQAFPDLSKEAFAELKITTNAIEMTLRKVMGFEKINYVILMMVDKEVHFHVIPRHSAPKTVAGIAFKDAGWPKHPDFNAVNEISSEKFAELTKLLKENWQK